MWDGSNMSKERTYPLDAKDWFWTTVTWASIFIVITVIAL